MIPDLLELFEAFNEHGVDYLLVGGQAVIAHGYVRATADVDIFLRPDAENARRTLAAMDEWSMPVGLTEAVLVDTDHPPAGFTFGVKPFRVDLLTALVGVSFDEACSGVTTVEMDGVPIRLVGLQELLVIKRLAGRPRDLEDVRQLERIHGLVDPDGNR